MTAEFDPVESLHAPITAIEASAGTGKTFALSWLAVRLIGDGSVVANRLLVVTFTNAAAAELKVRIRSHLIEAIAALDRTDPTNDYPVVAYLRTLDQTGTTPSARLQTALSQFEDLSVSTIHGFSNQMLASLGAAAGIDPSLRLAPDTAAANNTILTDLYAVETLRAGEPLPLTLATLRQYVLALDGAVDLILRPDPTSAPDDDETPERHDARRGIELAMEGVRWLADARRRRETRGYDQVITDLYEAVTGANSQAVLTSLRNRFSIALIDEFQDTDPVQWTIFRTLFAAADIAGRLVVVGDPKQAIYAFRGADLPTYLSAIEHAERRSLTRNWRSNEVVLRALNTFFEGGEFGNDARYTPVQVGDPNHQVRLSRRGADAASTVPGLSIRLALGDNIGDPTKRTKATATLAIDPVREAIHHDLAIRLIDLFDHHEITFPDEAPRAVRPEDVAVLVDRHETGEAIKDILTAAGIPAVKIGGASVLASAGAAAWRTLVDAMAQPSDLRRIRAVALGPFGPFETATALSDAPEAALEALQAQVAGWAHTLSHRGPLAMSLQVLHESGAIERGLGTDGGERLVIDLEHVAELIGAVEGSEPSRLLAAITPTDRAERVESDDPTARRVSDDAAAVQIMTMHTAKGLQFPIVCCPELLKSKTQASKPLIYHDDEGRVADFDPSKPAGEQAAAESAAERLRIAYVALTRAQCQTIVWWSRVRSWKSGPIGQLLFSRGTNGVIDPELLVNKRPGVHGDDQVVAVLDPLVERSRTASGEATISVDLHGWQRATRWNGPDGSSGRARPELRVATARIPDRRSRRWSFTALTTQVGANELSVAEPVAPGMDEGTGDPFEIDAAAVPESMVADDPGRDPDDLAPQAATIQDIPGGPAFGTLVHSVLERVDFTSDSLLDDLAASIDDELRWRLVDLVPRGERPHQPIDPRLILRDGLFAALSTPLGGFADHRPLTTFGTGDRLDELSFELRLGSNDHAAGLRDIARILADHLPADDPYRPWATGLAGGGVDVDLVGHLTGSIDLVLRVGEGADQRFVVVDYKTNRLPAGSTPTGAYGPAALAGAMGHHHYPLQALLYSVALHRYLRWRLRAYDPARHLGGVAYLFVRGMAGADTPHHDDVAEGVARWDLPPSAIVAVSDRLAGLHATRSDERVSS